LRVPSDVKSLPDRTFLKMPTFDYATQAESFDCGTEAELFAANLRNSRLRVFIHLDAPVAIKFQEMCAVRTFDSRNPLGRWASRQGLILPFEHKWLARV
jgi:hypothetical protein